MDIERKQNNGRMSQAVIHDRTVYLSGQVSRGSGTAAQATGILAAIDGLLLGAGTNKSNLLSVTIWLADMADYPEMNAIWDSWVDAANAPARATVEARLADPGFTIEIAAIAALP